MIASTFDQIGKVLREHQQFVVLSHVRPDGDALGSQLALGLSLQQLGKDVRIWNEEGMLDKYSFLPRAELLTKPPSTAEARRSCDRARYRNSKPAGYDARRDSFGEHLDQHRPSSQQSRLWGSGDHRSERACNGRNSFQPYQEPGPAFRS